MPKSKLRETQLVILSTAAEANKPIGRDDLKALKAKIRRYRLITYRKAV